MATVIIDNSSTQAKPFASYARPLPKRLKAKPQSEWDKAIAEGAVTPQEFHAMFEKEIKNNW